MISCLGSGGMAGRNKPPQTHSCPVPAEEVGATESFSSSGEQLSRDNGKVMENSEMEEVVSSANGTSQEEQCHPFISATENNLGKPAACTTPQVRKVAVIVSRELDTSLETFSQEEVQVSNKLVPCAMSLINKTEEIGCNVKVITSLSSPSYFSSSVIVTPSTTAASTSLSPANFEDHTCLVPSHTESLPSTSLHGNIRDPSRREIKKKRSDEKILDEGKKENRSGLVKQRYGKGKGIRGKLEGRGVKRHWDEGEGESEQLGQSDEEGESLEGNGSKSLVRNTHNLLAESEGIAPKRERKERRDDFMNLTDSEIDSDQDVGLESLDSLSQSSNYFSCGACGEDKVGSDAGDIDAAGDREVLHKTVEDIREVEEGRIETEEIMIPESESLWQHEANSTPLLQDNAATPPPLHPSSHAPPRDSSSPEGGIASILPLVSLPPFLNNLSGLVRSAVWFKSPGRKELSRISNIQKPANSRPPQRPRAQSDRIAPGLPDFLKIVSPATDSVDEQESVGESVEPVGGAELEQEMIREGPEQMQVASSEESEIGRQSTGGRLLFISESSSSEDEIQSEGEMMLMSNERDSPMEETTAFTTAEGAAEMSNVGGQEEGSEDECNLPDTLEVDVVGSWTADPNMAYPARGVKQVSVGKVWEFWMMLNSSCCMKY